jgi:hypothetical protein
MSWLRIIIAAVLGISAPIVQADKWVYGAAVEFESGSYSTSETTDIITLPVYITFYNERWGFGAEIPYVSITGSNDVIPSGNGQSAGHGKGQNATPDSTSTTSTRSGFGDLSLSVSYALTEPDSDSAIFYEVSGAVKLATADESQNLGTGENDYSVMLKASKAYGNWSPNVTIGYQFTGDTAVENYNDVYFYSIGSGYQVSEVSSVGVEYRFKQSITDSDDDTASIGASYTRVLNRYFDLGVSASTGLTDNSADFGMSLFLTGYY